MRRRDGGEPLSRLVPQRGPRGVGCLAGHPCGGAVGAFPVPGAFPARRAASEMPAPTLRHLGGGSRRSRRLRRLGSLALVLSLLLHALLLVWLQRVPIWIGSEAEEDRRDTLELAAEAAARADPAPKRQPLPRPRPRVTPVVPPPTALRSPDAIAADPTELFRELPSAAAVPHSPGFRPGRPGAYGRFENLIDAMRRRGLDVVLAIDTTGSMGWVLDEVRERIGALVETVRGFVPQTRFGIVAYRDYDANYVTKIQPLTYRVAKLRRFLGGLDAQGGGDVFEALDAAISEAIEQTGFREDRFRVLIVVGDAPPHPENMLRLLRRVRRFHRRGGIVTTLDVSLRSNPEVLRRLHGMEAALGQRESIPEYQELAAAGGGEALNLLGTTQVARNIAVAIFGSEWIEWVAPFLGEIE